MPRWGSFQARFEAAFGLAEHFAVTTAVRPVIIPDYRGDTFRLLGLSLGVRIR